MTHRYIGTKEVTAWPQNGPAKVKVCGVDCHWGDASCNGYCHDATVKNPPAADPQPGYAVKYPDGYISWSPAAAFESAYRVAEGDNQALTFGDALHFLKAGRRVTGKGWVEGSWLQLDEHRRPVVMCAQGGVYLWEPCVEDVMAEDWMVLP